MKFKYFLWAIALFTAVGFPQLGQGTSVDQIDLDGLTSSATTIITAEIVAAEVENLDNRFSTVLTLRVTDQIKGITQNTIFLRVPGGSVRQGRFRVAEVNAGVPRIFGDQDALLFLNESQQSNTYSLVGFTQGYMSIIEESGERFVQNAATDGKKITLTTMKESIAQLEAE